MRATITVGVALGGLLALAVSCTQAGEGALARASGHQFDHKAHLDRGVDCANCHGGEDVQWKAMPALETCMECHAEIDGEKPPETRAAAFYDEQGQGKWVHAVALDPERIFEHGKHAAKHPDCVACHQAVASSTALPSGTGLTMAACMDCHRQGNGGEAHLACASCHREIREDVPPPSHRVGWRERHGRSAIDRAAETMPEGCDLCHKRSDCDDCHRAEKPKNHTNLWRQHGHAARASLDRESCQTCHTTDSCEACHRESEPRTHRGAWGPPFDRHCNSCHLPLEQFGEEGCAVCHRGTPAHDAAPVRPGNPPHMTTNPDVCRTCHMPMPHPDNGQTCLFCHR